MSFNLVNAVAEMRPVLKAAGLKPADHATLSVIARHMNGKTWDRVQAGEIAWNSPQAIHDWCWAGIKTLAFEAGVDESTLSRSLRRLEKGAIIRTMPKGRDNSVYRGIVSSTFAELRGELARLNQNHKNEMMLCREDEMLLDEALRGEEIECMAGDEDAVRIAIADDDL